MGDSRWSMLENSGFSIIDSGYDNREWPIVKQELIRKYKQKYAEVKPMKVKTDTPGLKMWVVWVK